MATAPEKQAEIATAKPEPKKPMEIARSGPMDLRALRQVAGALWGSVQQFLRNECGTGRTLSTAQDTANEYNRVLKEIDDFYVHARHGLGDVKVYLIAESSGFTKQMEISIKEKEPGSDDCSLTLAK